MVVSAQVLCAAFLVVVKISLSHSKSFTIDYDNDVFLKDGRPFRYISGSFHYFRASRFYWKDRLQKMRSAGLNTVQTNYGMKTPKSHGKVLLVTTLIFWSMVGALDGTTRKQQKRYNKRSPQRLRSFKIDYDKDVFLKDGKPFRYIAGSFHYFRIPRHLWLDRLKKMRYAGLNTVDTYVAWNVHEQIEGQYNFDGDNDLVDFIQAAQSVGLLVIVRPGPYICAEWELGGLPAWLLKNYSSVKLRSFQDKRYIQAVDLWMGVLLPKLKSLLYANGGPIIAVQVENEYGSYITCDHQYMEHLQAVFERFLGKDVILFTTDGFTEHMLQCGTLPSLFTTVDFGPGVDPQQPFSLLRKFQKKGPLVNSEFYPGWLDHWGEPHQTRVAADVAMYLDKILAMNASVNLYMFEGGTNFGFMNGANGDSNSSHFQPQPTSYDYDAPLSEAGDPTQKYFLLMDVIGKYSKVPAGPVPPATPKRAYGKVNLTQLTSLRDALSHLCPAGPILNQNTLSMEELNHYYGFVLYRTQIPAKFAMSTAELNITGVRDRAIVFVGNERQVTLSRVKQTSAPLNIGSNLTLDILVENMGRINYGAHLQDPKGILGSVILGKVVLGGWHMFPLILSNVVVGCDCPDRFPAKSESTHPTFYQGYIPPAPDGVPKDTYLRLKGWTKGQAFVNGFNLGRYWPTAGPQDTLYVPANVLLGGQQPSKLVLLELDRAPCGANSTCDVEFVSAPVINGRVTPLKDGPCNARTPLTCMEDWSSKYVASSEETGNESADVLKQWG